MSSAWLLLPVGMMLIVLVVRLLAGSLDRDRIRGHLEERGWRVVEVRWSPFGHGWFGDHSNRIYRVRYRDEEDREHEAHCKTSLFGGVYLTEDRVVGRGREDVPGETPFPAARPERDLEEENRRLREEVDRLRRERGDRG
jgi:hypothetical protein